MTQSNQSLLFVGSYAPADQAGVQAFLFDEANGKLTTVGSYAGISDPTYLLVHPNKRWLYVVSEMAQNSHGSLGSVWAFRFEREPFTIQLINHQTSRGDWPCHLQFDATGRWLLATNYGTGNAGIFPIQNDGALGEMTDFVQHQGAGPNAARQEGPHAHSSIFTPDNRYVIIADLGIDQLIIYRFDIATGKLQRHLSVSTRPGAGPRHLVFHPNSKWMYAANELASTVTLYDYDSASGTLLERQTLSTLPSGAPENIVADIHISGAGSRVYVSNRGHNSIALYDVGGDGVLTLVSIQPSGGNWPRSFAFSPAEKFVLLANQYSNEVTVLPMAEGMPGLGAPLPSAPMAGASCVKFV